MLALAIEPVRYVTEHFIQRTAEKRCRTEPTAFRFLNLATSPVSVALSYYSSLLLGPAASGLPGRASRLVLVWRPAGASSFKEWAEQNPGLAKMLRDALVMGAAWTHERHQKPFSEDSRLRVGIVQVSLL